MVANELWLAPLGKSLVILDEHQLWDPCDLKALQML